MFDQAVLISLVDANSPPSRKSFKSRDCEQIERRICELRGGMLVASSRSAEFPDQDIAGWGVKA
jgi:hypothetical protein